MGSFTIVPNADQQEAARFWLNGIRSGLRADLNNATTHADVLRYLLAEPRLPHPDSLTDKQCFLMVDAMMFHSSRVEAMKQAYRALYDDLTKPKTKQVEAWSVCYAVKDGGRWMPSHSSVLYESKADAEAIADLKRGHGDCALVEVTGPFKRTVPAD